MRDMFGGLSIILAGFAIAVGIVWAAGNLALRMRYTAIAVGDSVVVVDERTGAVQTFERSKQPPNQFAYIATDGRALARERAEAATTGKAPSKSADDD
jgi:nucleoside phosphorylase